MLTGLFSWSGGKTPRNTSVLWWGMVAYCRFQHEAGLLWRCKMLQDLFRPVRLFQVLLSSAGNACIFLLESNKTGLFWGLVPPPPFPITLPPIIFLLLHLSNSAWGSFLSACMWASSSASMTSEKVQCLCNQHLKRQFVFHNEIHLRLEPGKQWHRNHHQSL